MCGVKVGAYEIFTNNTDVSYLPLSEMGHIAMLTLNLRRFPVSKSLFEINLNQLATNSLV